MSKQSEWAENVTTEFVTRMQQRRKELGMSAQDLANECVLMGYPIPRSTITKLEGGHRKNIQLHELLVLALALRVPPLELTVPLSSKSMLDVTPTKKADQITTLLWFIGDAPLDGRDGSDAERYMVGAAAINMIKRHANLIEAWQATEEALAKNKQAKVQGETVNNASKSLHSIALDLAIHRAQMKERGFPVPPLSALPGSLARELHGLNDKRITLKAEGYITRAKDGSKEPVTLEGFHDIHEPWTEGDPDA